MAKRSARRALLCAQCGYRVHMLASTRCPECGAVIDRLDDRTVSIVDPASHRRWLRVCAIVFGVGASVLLSLTTHSAHWGPAVLLLSGNRQDRLIGFVASGFLIALAVVVVVWLPRWALLALPALVCLWFLTGIISRAVFV